MDSLLYSLRLHNSSILRSQKMTGATISHQALTRRLEQLWGRQNRTFSDSTITIALGVQVPLGTSNFGVNRFFRNSPKREPGYCEGDEVQ